MTTSQKRKQNKQPGPAPKRASESGRIRKTHARSANGTRAWRRGQSGIHANGLFAATDIPKGTRVIEYLGHKLTKAQSYKRATDWLEKAQGTGKGAVYIFELNSKCDIDGNVPWNHARLANHSCKPNCEPRVIRGRIWIIAKRNIREGEELLYDYGYDLEHWEEHPCLCGASNCIGYIVGAEHRRKLRRILAKRKAEAAKPNGRNPRGQTQPQITR